MAAADVIKELAVSVGLDIDDDSFSAVEGLTNQIVGVLGTMADYAAQAATALSDMIQDVAGEADSIANLAQSVGISAGTLQELGYAVSLADISMEELGQTMALLGRNMAGAAASMEDQSGKAFKKLGVEVKDANGKLRATDEVLMDVAEKFQAMPDGAEKTTLALEIFGRAGKRLVPVLNQGRDGIMELRREAQDLGVVMSEDMLEAGGAVDDNLTRMRAAAKGLRNELAGPLLAALAPMLDGFVKWVRANREVVRARVAAFAQGLVSVLKVLGRVLSVVGKAFLFVTNNIKLFAVIAGSVLLAVMLSNIAAAATLAGGYVALGVAAVTSGLSAAAAWIAAAAPIAAVALGIAAAVLIAEDLYTWIQGGDSVLGTLWDNWKGFLADFGNSDQAGDPWWMKLLKDFDDFILNAEANWNLFADAVGEWFTEFMGNWQLVGNTILDVIDAIDKRLMGMIDAILEVVNDIPGVNIGTRSVGAAAVATAQGVRAHAGAATENANGQRFGPFVVPKVGPPGGGGAVVRQTVAPNITIHAPTGDAPAIKQAVKEALDEGLNTHYAHTLAAVKGAS